MCARWLTVHQKPPLFPQHTVFTRKLVPSQGPYFLGPLTFVGSIGVLTSGMWAVQFCPWNISFPCLLAGYRGSRTPGLEEWQRHKMDDFQSHVEGSSLITRNTHRTATLVRKKPWVCQTLKFGEFFLQQPNLVSAKFIHQVKRLWKKGEEETYEYLLKLPEYLCL